MDINQLCPHCLRIVKDKDSKKFCNYCGKPLKQFSEVQHQLPPQSILAGKYLIGDVLGEGGFGITYVGFDLNLEMRVAIKEFYPNGYVTREARSSAAVTMYAGANMEAVQKWRDSFIKEARSLAKCSHLSGVVGVKDFFQENNTAYIILEYLEGTDLKNYVRSKGGKVSVDWLMSALEPVVLSLGEVHKQGIVHRDISPDNIRLLPDGKMKLMDFGAARDYTESGEKSLSVMLKHGYAPEEQYRSKGVQGPWTDIYALAGTIYKCITGLTPPEAAERIRKDELQKPSVLGVPIRPKAEQALMKALAVYADQRYQNMEDFYRDIYAGIERVSVTVDGNAGNAQGITSGRTSESTSFIPPESSRKVLGTNKKILIPVLSGVAALVVVIVIVAAIGKRSTTGISREETLAEADVQEVQMQDESVEEESVAAAETIKEAESSDGGFVDVPQRAKQFQESADASAAIFIYADTVENYANAIDPATYAYNDAHMQEQGIYFNYYIPCALYYSNTFEYNNSPWEEGYVGYGFQSLLTSHAKELTGTASQNMSIRLAKKCEIGYFGSAGSTLDSTLWEYDEPNGKIAVTNYLAEISSLYAQTLEQARIVRTPGSDGVLCVEGEKDGYTHRILIAIDAYSNSVMRMWIAYPTTSATEEEALQKEYVTECIYRMCEFARNTDQWNPSYFVPYEQYKAERQ